MARADTKGRLAVVSLISTAVLACGGVTVERSPSSGGASNGGSGSAAAPSGTGGALPDCKNPVPDGTSCETPGAHCGGPCSNSWRADNVCENGWRFVRTVRCGPDASRAPQCHNSFSGGELTPCCPPDKLDCTGKPDGYPGFGCTPGEDSFCSCTCYSGEQVCGC